MIRGGLTDRNRNRHGGHTEGASFPFPSGFAAGGEVHSPVPDLLVIVELCNPEGTPTRLAPVSLALKDLADEEPWAMGEPWFDIAPQATFDTDRIRIGAPADAGVALRRFEEALADLYVEVPTGPGDFFLIHGRQVIHGRAAPGPGFGGTTRWLLRTCGWMGNTVGHLQSGGASHCHL